MKITIKKVLVFIDDGTINGNNDIYRIGNIKIKNNPLPIFYNFDPAFPIGKSFLTRDKDNPGRIYAEIHLLPKSNEDAEKVIKHFSGAFPAIKGILLADENNKKKVDGFEIQSLGICTEPNSDDRIQPILEKDMELVENEKDEEIAKVTN